MTGCLPERASYGSTTEGKVPEKWDGILNIKKLDGDTQKYTGYGILVVFVMFRFSLVLGCRE